MRTDLRTLLAGAVLTAGGVPLLGQAKPVDACAVLPASVVESITGDDMNSGKRTQRNWLDAYVNYQCDYRGAAGWRVGINIERGRTTDGAKEYFKVLRGVVKQTTPTSAQPVPGLGDEAWWGPVSPTNGMLHVRIGSDVVWIQTYGQAPGAGSLEKTRALMLKALEQFAKVK